MVLFYALGHGMWCLEEGCKAFDRCAGAFGLIFVREVREVREMTYINDINH